MDGFLFNLIKWKNLKTRKSLKLIEYSQRLRSPSCPTRTIKDLSKVFHILSLCQLLH